MARKKKLATEEYTTVSIRVTPRDRQLIADAAYHMRFPGIATYCRNVLVKDAEKVMAKIARKEAA